MPVGIANQNLSKLGAGHFGILGQNHKVFFNLVQAEDTSDLFLWGNVSSFEAFPLSCVRYIEVGTLLTF